MILVIDDEVEVCELMADYLKGQGMQVMMAHNVPEALKAIKEGVFSLIICDLVLDSGKGESVLSYLRKKGSGHEMTPCLFVSGKKGPDEISLSKLDSYLAKPFSEEEFLKAVEISSNTSLKRSEKSPVSSEGKSQVHPNLRKLMGN